MPRKGQNIYKRKDGRWEGRYIRDRDPNGKPIRGYVYAKTYRDVKEKLTEAIVACQTGREQLCSNEAPLFETIAQEWLETNKSQIKISTQNKYWNLLDSYILPILGKRTLSAITHDCLESFCTTLLAEGGINQCGLSPKTVSDVLSVIRSILQLAVKKGHSIPCDASTIHIKKATKTMRVLSMHEQEKLCQYLYSNLDPCNLGILVCLFTGLRVGEICALRWEDISFAEQTIYVHKTMQRVQDRSGGASKTKVIITTPKSACSIRIIPLPDNIVRTIRNFSSSHTGYFLTSNDQRYIEPRTMQNRFRLALKSASIEYANYHALRHTFATRCVECGFDVKSLSEILGHASVNITMNRYVHPSLELKKENMQRLSSLLAVK